MENEVNIIEQAGLAEKKKIDAHFAKQQEKSNNPNDS
jgi:hypothetical protein